jgi:hypothetical protein
MKKIGDDCVLESHNDAIEDAKISGHGFDQVETFDISVSERELALSDLSFMNITAYTLFKSVDSLIETTIPLLFET